MAKRNTNKRATSAKSLPNLSAVLDLNETTEEERAELATFLRQRRAEKAPTPKVAFSLQREVNLLTEDDDHNELMQVEYDALCDTLKEIRNGSVIVPVDPELGVQFDFGRDRYSARPCWMYLGNKMNLTKPYAFQDLLERDDDGDEIFCKRDSVDICEYEPTVSVRIISGATAEEAARMLRKILATIERDGLAAKDWVNCSEHSAFAHAKRLEARLQEPDWTAREEAVNRLLKRMASQGKEEPLAN
jgi:hypothetical protein